MPKQVRLRRGTTAQHNTFTGAQGEVTYDTDKKTLVVHDGATQGGQSFDRFLLKTPATALTIQNFAGVLDVTGGDSETNGLTVTNQASFNSVAVNADLRVKDLHYTQQGLLYASSIQINFALGQYTAQRVSLTGNLTLTGTGYLFGSYRQLFITSDASTRTLTFPAAWKFIGAAAPANIAASKVGLLQLWSYGTTENEVLARWLVQP
jgi:hypothetical protein